MGGTSVDIGVYPLTRSAYFIAFMDLKARDVEEGADMLMVKPGIMYLDVLRETRDKVR